MRGRRWILLFVLLAAEGAALRMAVQRTFEDRPVLLFESIALGLFLLNLIVLRGLDVTRRAGSMLVVGCGAVFQLLALTRPPVDSDDDFRYLWDGRVQLAGIDPYRYAPSSPALARLRDEYLFPAVPAGGHCVAHALPDGLCTRINLPDAHTIYPPVAEAAFTLARILSFGGRSPSTDGRHLPLQLAAAAGAVIIAVLLARRGQPLWSVAIWAWCPVTVIELGNNAHIDWLAVLLGVLALTAAARGRVLAAGLLLGAGIATKLYPALLGPAMLRRRPWRLVAAAASFVVVGYLPHVLVVGSSVLGYLPTYLNQGGYGNGQQYRLLGLIFHGAASTAAAVVVMGTVTGWALWKGDPERPERVALLVVGVGVLVATPPLPWYTLLLLALVAMNARPEWLGVVVAPTVEYLLVGTGHDAGSTTTGVYLAGLLVLATGHVVRRRLDDPRCRHIVRTSSTVPALRDVP